MSKDDIVMFYYVFVRWIDSLEKLFYLGVYSPCSVEIQQFKETKYEKQRKRFNRNGN